VGAVGPDDWERATPCSGWSVRDLVNHVVGEELWTVPLVQGSTIEAVGARFDGDVLGNDPLARSRAAATEAVAVVDERAPTGGTVHLSYGEEGLDEYVRQLSADHLVHGWDLAVAIGADTRMAPELVDAVADWFREREELYRSAGMIGRHLHTDGDAQTRLLAAFGRDAHWAATP
jgi:uncharacterized protein (TIGR03086 family)